MTGLTGLVEFLAQLLLGALLALAVTMVCVILLALIYVIITQTISFTRKDSHK